MKIVQPIGTIAGTAISKIAISLAEEFARQGHDSTLVVWNKDKIDREIDPRVTIKRVSLLGLSRRHLGTKLLRGVLASILGRRFFLVLMAPFLSQQLQRKVLTPGGYDVAILHAHSVFGFRYIKTPFLLVAHNNKSLQLLQDPWQWRRNLKQAIYRSVYRKKRISCVSKGIGDDLVANFDANPEQIETIYNPLDISLIKKLSQAPLPDDAPADGYLIAIGRDDPQKRFDRLLRAFALSKVDKPLLLLGRGAENKELHQQAKQLGISEQVHFLGFRDNPYRYIANADALVMSSDFEGFGMVLVESLVCGTPAISTDCPYGPNEVLTEELAKWLVPVEDEIALAAKISEILVEKPTVPEKVANKFSLDIVAKQYLLALSNIVSKTRNDNE